MGSFISTYWSPLWDGEFADFTELEDLYNTMMASICVICAGLAAGLTMGLLSLGSTLTQSTLSTLLTLLTLLTSIPTLSTLSTISTTIILP